MVDARSACESVRKKSSLACAAAHASAGLRPQDPHQFTSAQRIDQLEGLAVATPWGFESLVPHHSTRLPARLRQAEGSLMAEPLTHVEYVPEDELSSIS